MDIAYKEAQIYSLQLQLKDFKGSKKHKRMAVDPNTKFVNIDLIKEAMGEAEKEKAKETKSRPEMVSA